MEQSQFHRADFQQFVQDHLNEDPALLLFRYQGKIDFDLRTAVQQISARQKVAKKLPSWASDSRIIFPPSISLEQSSSEETARFKAKNLSGKIMIDLTGGFGVDSYFLSENFERAIYCEQQEELAEIATNNLEILAPGKFEIFKGDGLDFLEKSTLHFDLIYADPARRGKGNQKLFRLQDCEPDVVSAWELMKSKSDHILIKASPMLDISQSLTELPDIQKVHVISVKNEVKELLLEWKKGSATNEKEIEAVDLGEKEAHFSFTFLEESEAESIFGEAENYLVEPLSAILKAGAFKSFGQRFGLKKLEKNSHLYTSASLPKEIPGRVFEVLSEIQPKKESVKKLFPSGKANVITRNYATGSEELKKKLGLKDGGKDFLIGTRTLSGFRVFHCRLVK
ncbi:MAG: class I SAM-dependent methyltransferase [Algoriphagus sp.]|nr:class I SAM-dependent methyltransferase [Algoriphagus sp.]